MNYKKILPEKIKQAEERIAAFKLVTPLEYSPFLSKKGGCSVYLKLENLQTTKSFKLRGALNKVLSLSEEERSRGIIAASSGNHAAAVAWLLEKFSIKGNIFLPENASSAKINALKDMRCQVTLYGNDCIKSETLARETAIEEGKVLIAPYNDLEIIAGQGTIGLELENQLDSFDSVVAPVGGGGLISGIAGYIKGSGKSCEIIGCQPLNSAVMYESLIAGRILDLESLPTIADGAAGGIEEDSITFDICQQLVDRIEILSEEEICRSVKILMENHHMLVEGAAALSTACFLKNINQYKGKTVVLVVSGAKISLETLQKILAE